MESSPGTVDAPVTQTPKQGRRWGRIALIVVVIVVVGLGVLVALAPSIASSVAPGIIEKQAAAQLKGTVKVARADFSWGGPQRIGPVEWTDPEGKTVAKGTVQSSAGLLGFVRGSLDLGQVTITEGEARIVRSRDGTLNVQTLAAPKAASAPKAKEPARIPAGLRLHAEWSGLKVIFVDEAAPDGRTHTTTLRDVNGSAVVNVDQPLEVKLKGTAQGDAGGEGRVAIDVRATNWANPDGLITPSKATVTATATLETFPTALLETLVPGVALSAVGPTVDARVDANGSLKEAVAKITATTEGANVQGEVHIAESVLTTPTPLEVKLKGPAVAGLLPALGAATAPEGRARINALPDATLTIDNVNVTMPQAGQAMDLRGASARVRISLQEMVGSAALAEGAAPQEMRIKPLTAVIETADLAGNVRCTLNTGASLNGQDAGDIALDMTASGLLDEQGALRAGLPQLSGTAQVRQTSTAIAQPFVQAMGLDLPRDIGPTIDVDLRAASRAGRGTDIDMTAKAERLTAQGGFTLTPAQIATRSNDFTVSLSRGAELLGAFVPKSAGVTVGAPGAADSGVLLTLRGLNIPRDEATGAVMTDRATGTFTLTLAGVRLTPADEASAPIDLSNLQLRGQLMAAGGAAANASAGGAKVDIQGAGKVRDSDFTIKGDIAVAQLWRPDAAGAPAMNTDLPSLSPAGRIQVLDLPTSALSAFMPRPAPATPDAPPPMDLAALVNEAFGERVNLDLGIKRTDVKDTSEFVARVNATGEGASNLVTRFRLSPTELKGTENAATLRITPGLMDAVLRSASPAQAGKLRLSAPATVQVGLKAFSVPVVAGAPQWDKASPVQATVSIPANLDITGLDALGGAAMKGLASAGVEGLTIDVNAAPAAFMTTQGQATPSEVTANVRGGLRCNGERVGALTTTVRMPRSAGQASGPIVMDVALSEIATAKLETALGKPALLTGLLGESAQIAVKGTHDAASQTTAADLTVSAPRLKADGPIAVKLSPQAIQVTKAAKWVFTLEPAWLNERLAARSKTAKPGTQPPPAAFSVTKPVELALTIDSLALPRAEGGPALAAALGISVPRLETVTADKRTATFDGTSLTLTTRPGTSESVSPIVDFRLNIAGATASGEGTPPDVPRATNVGLSGSIENLVGPSGAVDTTTATLSASGRLPAIPTALVDMLAGQDGVLVEALGPMVSLDIEAQRWPLGGEVDVAQDAKGAPASATPRGMLKVNARSDRATLTAEGSIDNAVLTLTEPLNVSISELTEALAGRFVKGLPSVGTIQKTREDAPAMIVADNLRVPLSKDMSKLNGVVRIDPGEARFTTSSFFGKLLDMAKVTKAGQVGKQLEPLTVTIKNGVASYPRYGLPLGEFKIETEGSVDLAQRRIDVVTWVPLGSLTDQAIGLFGPNIGIGSLTSEIPGIDNATMMPFRTRGSYDDPKTSADLELFGKNVLKSVNPLELIKKGLDELKDKPKDGG